MNEWLDRVEEMNQNIGRKQGAEQERAATITRLLGKLSVEKILDLDLGYSKEEILAVAGK